MNRRWQASLSPFNGECLVTDDLISVEELRTLLDVVAAELEGLCAAQALYTFDDWHQHDGYVTERRTTDWRVLAAATATDAALIASRQGDYYVHRSFYPEDFAFLLRYDVTDEDNGDGIGFTGTFDISASSGIIHKLASLIPLNLRTRLRIELSKDYFDKTYAG